MCEGREEGRNICGGGIDNGHGCGVGEECGEMVSGKGSCALCIKNVIDSTCE